VFRVVGVPDGSLPEDASELSLMVPVPGSAINSVILEKRDGASVREVTALGVSFHEGGPRSHLGHQTVKVRRSKVAVVVIDARLAIACSKYDKGDYSGNSDLPLALDLAGFAVDSVRARFRSRRKVLVGQVRYPWLRQVGSSIRNPALKTHDRLVLVTADPEGGVNTVDIALPDEVSGPELAAEIARRAAHFRLTVEDLDDDARAVLTERLDAEALIDDVRGFQYHEMPASHAVSEESARLGVVAA
jgi:hypothetical protein